MLRVLRGTPPFPGTLCFPNLVLLALWQGGISKPTTFTFTGRAGTNPTDSPSALGVLQTV